jgi:hypothetical protein
MNHQMRFLAEQHRNALLREAANDRLARLAKAGQVPRRPRRAIMARVFGLVGSFRPRTYGPPNQLAKGDEATS